MLNCNANYKYLFNILKKSPGHLYWKDKDGIYQGSNDAQAIFLGYKSMKELIGKTDFDLLWKDKANFLREIDKQVMEKEEEYSVEESVKDCYGNNVVFFSRKIPLYDPDTKKVIGIIGASLDITMLKAAQEAAEAANQAKTEFLENMRHDLRTPLSGIVGCAELIQSQSNNPEKVADYASNLIESSNALLEFLNKILESIEVATGEIPLLKKRFNLYQMLDQVVRLSKPQADVKNLNLHLDYDQSIPVYLLGDPVRVQRIVLELVANALKFTAQGEVKIVTRLLKNEARQVIINLGVSDTGKGIPADKQNEVYTRFKRLTPSYQGIYAGTGLGLSVVKQFIDELGGEIQLESKPHHGSTFTCLIPFQESLATSDGSDIEENQSFALDSRLVDKSTEELKSVSAEQEKVVTTGNRVLVVEDNFIAAKVVQGILLNLKCQLDIAVDSKTALENLEKHHYDLIMMDIGLKDGEDGCDVTRRIRLKQWQHNPSVPIIGLTAHISEEKKQSCFKSGMNAIYIKPLTSEKASEILNTFLSNPQAVAGKEKPAKPSDNLQLLPLIDKAQAMKLLGSEKLFKETLKLLVSSLTKELKQLKQAHQANVISVLAHKWQGGGCYCGASRLVKVCQQLGESLQFKRDKEAEENYQQLLLVAELTKEAAKKEVYSE